MIIWPCQSNLWCGGDKFQHRLVLKILPNVLGIVYMLMPLARQAIGMKERSARFTRFQIAYWAGHGSMGFSAISSPEALSQ
jgi:hypothetical protein